jgi:hypothetical protein
MRPLDWSWSDAVRTACLCATLTAVSCRAPADGPSFIQPKYDEQTGKLKQLQYDSDKDGKVDTISYMDGTRVLRVEIDKDEDGKVDRWEYYGPDQKLEKVGISRANDGKEDTWSYAAADGTITHIEIAGKRDGKVSRIEHYEKEQPVSAEEDTDGDGRMDKWETFDAGRLTSVAFDTAHRGSPDRRLVYGSDGTVRVETDPQGDGKWKPSKP